MRAVSVQRAIFSREILIFSPLYTVRKREPNVLYYFVNNFSSIYSDLIPQLKEEILAIIELVKPKCHEIEFEEFKFEVHHAFLAVSNFQKQLRRDFIQSSDWDSLYNEMDPSLALTTVGMNLTYSYKHIGLASPGHLLASVDGTNRGYH